MGKRMTDGAIALFIAFMTALFLLMMPRGTVAEEVSPPERLPPSVSDWRRLTPRQYLYARYEEEAPTLDKIIACESGWKADAKNSESTASGLAQFLDSTWISTRNAMRLAPDLAAKLDPYQNIDAAVFLYHQQGTRPWMASKGCHHL